MPPKANPKGGRSANKYKFPERLPEGEVLQDVTKNRWILGPSIGKGGFGEIYSAAKYVDGKPKDYPYVIKIEPHENGPLFVEMHFYQRVVKSEDVAAWKKKEKVEVLGVPSFYGSGSHMFENYKYRFIVIDRFGKDLWSIFLDNNRSLPESTVYKCAVQILNVLKYIHENGYTHGDIKGANLLLGYKSAAQNDVFLVDYGLACKLSLNEFKPNPKRAGDGTIEYTSCDMHLGVPTPRGDLEILGYNLLHWLVGKLPWEGETNVEKVHEKKKEMMQNVRPYLKKKFPKLPEVMLKYFDYVSKLKHDETPDIKFCKSLFINALKSTSSLDGPLFPRSKSPAKASGASKKKSKPEDDVEPEIKKKKAVRRGAKSDTRAASDEAEPEIKKGKAVRRGAKSSTRALDAASDGAASDGDMFEDSPPAIKRPNTNSEEAEEKRGRKTRKVANGTDKPSWKDMPTVSWSLKKTAGNEPEAAPKTRSTRKKT